MAYSAQTPKHIRIAEMVARLMNGEVLYKEELANRFGVNLRSVQRDLDDLKAFFADRTAENGGPAALNYDYIRRGYVLEQSSGGAMTDGEALAACKILLESRSLRKDELFPILEKIIRGCVPLPARKQAEQLILNERFLYIEPHHGQLLLDRLWEIGQAVREQRYVDIEYHKLKGQETVRRKVKPVGLMFSEFYFYMTAFIEHEGEEKDPPHPTIYRVDRIQACTLLDEHFRVPYKDRFQEGEFRKRVQFMFGGELRKVRFQYCGLSIEAVLDRLPTAQILDEKDGVYTVEAEVFGDGIDMWLRGQGTAVTVLNSNNM